MEKTNMNRTKHETAVGMTKRSHPMRTMLLAVAVAIAAGASAMAPGAASAQEVQISGPLAGQPAVRHMRVYRAGRFNLMPTIAYTLQDEFARSLFVGLEANYHFTDWIGVGIWGAYNPADISTDLTSQITSTGQTTDRNRLSLPYAGNFGQQIGHIRWGVSAHLIFVPLRGKLSLFQSVFIDTDLYIFAGIAIWGVEERAYTDAATAMCTGVAGAPYMDQAGHAIAQGQSQAGCVASQFARASRVAPAPIFGVGLSLYANSWFGISLEWRATVFSWNPAGTDESGFDQHGQPGSGFPDGHIDGNDSRTIFTHMMQLGFTFLLPPDQTVTD
jgi:outer membrane beta-barrel protein